MTNEQAINLITRISYSQHDAEKREALDMAIRALEQNLVQESGDLVQDLVKDCISRQQAIDVLKGLPTWWADGGGYYGGAQPPMVALLDPEDAVSAIENLPSAQPERKTGRWKLLYDNIWICTNCEQTEQFGVNIESTSDYCPNCGARMER